MAIAMATPRIATWESVAEKGLDGRENELKGTS